MHCTRNTRTSKNQAVQCGLIVFLIFSWLSLSGCGGGGSSSGGTGTTTQGSGSQTSAPGITGISPSTLPASASPQQLTINGANFQSGATVTYHDPQGNTSAGHATTFASATQIADSAFNNANNPGTWTVTVVNPGNTSSNAYSFTVTAAAPAAPAITGVSPSPVPGSASAQQLTINGSGFQTGATLTYKDPQGNASAGHPTTFGSATQIVDTAFNNANNPGAWTVTVVNPGNTSSNAYTFTVTATAPAPPAITGVSPSPVPGSASPQALTINGSGFQSGATVTYHDPQGNVSAGHATTFGSANQIVDSAFNNANNPGTWTLAIVNPDNSTSITYSFTVTAPPFTLVQHKVSTCTSSPCADAISSTAAGDLLVLWSAAKYSGTGSAIAAGFTGASGDSAWTHCPNQIANYISGVSTARALDCWYILSATGGATSVSASWTFAGLTSPSYAVADDLFELRPASTPIYYDTGNAGDNFTNCSTTCAGPAALLSDTDAVLQATMLSSLPTTVAAPYTAPDILTNVNSAFSVDTNQSSYTQPIWAGTSLANPSFYSTIAFGNNPNPPLTLDYLMDFSACTAGTAPTLSCLKSSTFTGTFQSSPSITGMGPNLVVTNSGPSSLLPFSPTIFNGVAKTGADAQNLGCTTSGTGNSCGTVNVAVDMVPTSISIGYTFQSDCPATGVDCGAIGGIFSRQGPDFDVVHLSVPTGKICFETQGGSGCAGQNMLDYVPGKAYRVNMQINTPPATSNYITVCEDGPSGAVLASWSNGATPQTAVDNKIVLGISGEEPHVAGYTYSWRNYVVSLTGQFSSTSCF